MSPPWLRSLIAACADARPGCGAATPRQCAEPTRLRAARPAKSRAAVNAEFNAIDYADDRLDQGSATVGHPGATATSTLDQRRRRRQMLRSDLRHKSVDAQRRH